MNSSSENQIKHIKISWLASEVPHELIKIKTLHAKKVVYAVIKNRAEQSYNSFMAKTV